MSKRTILIIIGLGIVLIGGTYVISGATKTLLPYTVTKTGDRQHREETEYYTIQIDYPDKTPLSTQGGWGAEGRAQSTIAHTLLDLIKQFKDAGNLEFLSQEEKQRIKQSGITYALTVGYHPYTSSSFVSYEFEIYVDTGGAHPNNIYKTLVFDMKGDTVSLGELFTPRSNYLERISSAARTQIVAQLKKRAGADAAGTLIGEGIAPSEENFANFVIDNDRIRIFIPPYQAAAYAAGSFEVVIPLADLKDILKPEVK